MTDYGISPSQRDTFHLNLRESIAQLGNGDLLATISLANQPISSLGDGIADAPINPTGQRSQVEWTRQPLVYKEHLGAGGMSIVNAAEQRCLERDVAIKQVRNDRLTQTSLANLIREAKFRQTRSSQYFADYDLSRDDDGHPVIVMNGSRRTVV